MKVAQILFNSCRFFQSANSIISKIFIESIIWFTDFLLAVIIFQNRSSAAVYALLAYQNSTYLSFDANLTKVTWHDNFLDWELFRAKYNCRCPNKLLNLKCMDICLNTCFENTMMHFSAKKPCREKLQNNKKVYPHFIFSVWGVGTC